MKHIRLFLFLSSLLLINTVTSAQTGTLRGTVIDSAKGEVLPFANIIISGTKLGTSTDLNGNFTITGVPAGIHTAAVSYLGYKADSISVEIKRGKVTQVNIPLSPINIELEEIEMVGEKMVRPNETNLGLQKITIRELELLPKSVETDIFRSLQFVPGVQSTGDVSARYYVRGGGSNQNLVLLNGVSVYNPFHALGLFSIIDPEMINAVEFYKGGFSADLGGRLSSVLDLVTKDGNKNYYGGSAAISFLTAKAAVEGPIPSGSFILTGRKSLFSNTLKKFINLKDAPFEFYDISGKISYANTEGESLTKISLHGFNSQDKLVNESPYKADYKWTNNIYGAYWFQAWEDVPIYSETNFSVSSFRGDIDPKYGLSKQRHNDITDVTLGTDFTNIFSNRDEIKLGWELKSVSTSFNFENLQGIKSAVADKGFHFTFYGKYKFLRFEDLGMDVGARVNAITMAKTRSATIEPRVNLTYVLYPGIKLKGAWGIYTQELITLTDENEIISIFEPWLITPDYLKIPEAIHYVAGLDITTLGNVNLSIEAYYKDLKYTAEVNQLKADEIDPDFIQGSGEAYGTEFQLRYSNPFVAFTGSYSLSWTYRNINGWISYPKYDARHVVTTNLAFDFGSGWYGSISWFFNSGLPFTQILGYYDKLFFEELFNKGLYGYYLPYTILDDPNLGRLPTYHRLDLSVTKRVKFFFTNTEISLSVMNVYDRQNIFYFERATGERVNMLPFFPTATIKVEI